MNAEAKARAEFLEGRRKILGGSDTAALLGVSPYKEAADVWVAKLGLAQDDEEESKATRRGNRLEGYVLDEYEAVQGVKLTRALDLPLPLIHPEHPWLGANLDARRPDGRPVEAKTAAGSVAWLWGNEGTDEVPAHHIVQVQHYLAVTGEPWADVVALIGGHRFEFRFFRIMRDDELIAHLIDVGRRFWHEHVLTGIRRPRARRSACGSRSCATCRTTRRCSSPKMPA